MDSKKSRYAKYLDNDFPSKPKQNKSKNKSKSKKQHRFDKNSALSPSISSSNSQFQSTSNLPFQSTNSSSSNITLTDKKKSSQNKKSTPKESTSRLESSILLCFPDGDIPAQEDNDPYTMKIGGKPNWLRESHPLSHDVIICKNCGKDMFLLFQGYVPLGDSVYDRVIYVFGCNQQKCMNKNGSFCVYRAHRKDEEYERRYQQELISKYRSNNNNNNSSTQPSNIISEGLGNMLFGVTDFDDIDYMQISDKEGEDVVKDENDEKEDNYEDDEWPELNNNNMNNMSCATKWQPSWSQIIENARNEQDQVSSKRDNNNNDISQIDIDMSMMTLKTNWPKDVKSFPAQYLYTTEEVLEEKRNDDILKNHANYEEFQDLLENEDNLDWSGEKYEKAILPKGYNKTLQNFSDRVAEWPDQCVRYQFDGQPLLYTHNDEAAKLLDNCSVSSKLPNCHHCGSKRVFELQLMPSMLSILSTSSYTDKDEESFGKKYDNSIFDLGMEWGTIMVFTCKNDCEKIGVGFDEVTYYEEIVMVQYEQ